jgi:formate-dependent nitrite reductase membrane component NrfD
MNRPGNGARPGAAERARGRWGQHGGHQHSEGQGGEGQGDGGQRRGPRGAGRQRGEPLVVPRAQFDSYYGRPILKAPVWRSPDVPGYLFLGGLSGASSVLAGFAQLTGNHELSRAAKTAAAGAIGLSAAALVHDLGRPERFLNMMRVFKVTSPMSIGSWLLASYGPCAGAAGACAVTGRLPRAGALATAGATVLGPGIATYTAALLSDTSVPAWHEAHREMPYLFAGSAASAAGGLAMMAVRPGQAGQAVRFAVLGAAVELTAKSLLLRRLGPTAEPYQSGRPGTLMEAAEVLTAAGLAGAVLTAGRSRAATAISGAALVAASALTRFGIFEAGLASARDPKYTVGPQRERLRQRAASPDAQALTPASPRDNPRTPG